MESKLSLACTSLHGRPLVAVVCGPSLSGPDWAQRISRSVTQKGSTAECLIYQQVATPDGRGKAVNVQKMAGEAGIEPALTRFWRPPLFR